MFVEQGHAGEGAGARLALVLLDIRVGLEVGPKVGAVGEGAAAVGAGEGLLPWGEKAGGGQEAAKLLGQQLNVMETPSLQSPPAPNTEGVPRPRKTRPYPVSRGLVLIGSLPLEQVWLL